MLRQSFLLDSSVWLHVRPAIFHELVFVLPRYVFCVLFVLNRFLHHTLFSVLYELSLVDSGPRRLLAFLMHLARTFFLWVFISLYL